jgi:hypothetical protein
VQREHGRAQPLLPGRDDHIALEADASIIFTQAVNPRENFGLTRVLRPSNISCACTLQ